MRCGSVDVVIENLNQERRKAGKEKGCDIAWQLTEAYRRANKTAAQNRQGGAQPISFPAFLLS
jgi:hypothetical protein